MSARLIWTIFPVDAGVCDDAETAVQHKTSVRLRSNLIEYFAGGGPRLRGNAHPRSSERRERYLPSRESRRRTGMNRRPSGSTPATWPNPVPARAAQDV